jgi:hypothetical protein
MTFPNIVGHLWPVAHSNNTSALANCSAEDRQLGNARYLGTLPLLQIL